MATTKVKKDSKVLNKEIGNALFSDDERFEMFFAANWKKIMAAAVAVVVVITLVFAIRLHIANNAKRASARLATASTAADLEKALAENADAAGADAARFRLAGMYIADKKYAQAQVVLDKLAVSAAEPSLRNKANLSAAYMSEMSGKLAEAAQRFSAIAALHANPAAMRAEAAYAAGRLYLALNKKTEAKQVLNHLQLMETSSGSNAVVFWKERAQMLERSIN